METARLPVEPDVIAPDGAEVRILVIGAGASMAHFPLGPNQTSISVTHRTVEELWYFTGGQGPMWQRSARTGEESVVEVETGVALTIPNHTHFQFRSQGSEPLTAVGVTMPPSPGIGDLSGKGEIDLVDGPWKPTVASGMSDQS